MSAGVNIKAISVTVLVLIKNSITNVKVHPIPNIIKSKGVKKPNINIDFLEFAGIKYVSFTKYHPFYFLLSSLEFEDPPPKSILLSLANSFKASRTCCLPSCFLASPI